jgi:hypothetical protein
MQVQLETDLDKPALTGEEYRYGENYKEQGRQAAELPGQRQGNQAAPGKVPGLIQLRHGFFLLAARERSIFALIRETWRRAYSASGAVTVPTGSP